MTANKYTLPKLNKTNPKAWYLGFTFNGRTVRIKRDENQDYNRIKDLSEREYQFLTLSEAIKINLKRGWNPFVEGSISNVQPTVQKSITEALDFAMEKKTPLLSTTTVEDYKATIRFFNSAAKKLKLDKLNASEIKRTHIKLIFDKIKTDREWSNKSYNKNLGYIKAIFSELLEWDLIDANPAHGIRQLKTEETQANTPLSDSELKKVKEHLLNKFPNFLYYIETIYHTGIRPNELLSIKVSNVDFGKMEIILTATNSKVKKQRHIPINKFMFAYLEKIITEKTPKDFYLFGTQRENRNLGLSIETDFIPGIYRLGSDTATKLWWKLIIKGLGINKTMYSIKHLGGDKKILSGMDLDTIREVFGHSKKRMTAQYISKLNEVYKKDFLDNSPEF